MAQGVYLNGWDAENQVWRRILVNEEGKLIIDPTEIFEDEPTDNEHGKAPTSNWAHDHDANADAHHVRYTDAEARAAINDIFGANGKATKHLNLAHYYLEYVGELHFWGKHEDVGKGSQYYESNYKQYRFWGRDQAGNYADIDLMIYKTDHYERIPTEPEVDTKISDHAAIEDAHHAKYTDAEARAACKLSGDVYYSVPGCAFIPIDPLADIVSYNYLDGFITLEADNKNIIAPVHLPDGVTVKSVLFEGNAAAEDSYVMMRRLHLSTHNAADMAIGQVGDEITTIYNSVIDNQNYVYFLGVSSLKTNDIIYGARIKYNL